MTTSPFLLPIVADADKWATAACIGWPIDVFFPKNINVETASLAIAICSDCKLKDACRAEYADEPHGVFGGTTPRQRTTTRNQGATA